MTNGHLGKWSLPLGDHYKAKIRPRSNYDKCPVARKSDVIIYSVDAESINSVVKVANLIFCFCSSFALSPLNLSKSSLLTYVIGIFSYVFSKIFAD